MTVLLDVLVLPHLTYVKTSVSRPTYVQSSVSRPTYVKTSVSRPTCVAVRLQVEILPFEGRILMISLQI